MLRQSDMATILNQLERRGPYRPGRSELSKFFIGAGCLIIVILFTALIGPYFVDWTSYRETFEREASTYVGPAGHRRGKGERPDTSDARGELHGRRMSAIRRRPR